MTSDVEARIHRALQAHALERTAQGYRLVHPGGAGVGTLCLRPVAAPSPPDGEDAARPRVVAIAEITAEHAAPGLPNLHALGLQRLNGMAVYGAYQRVAEGLRQTAQYSIFADEPAPHHAAQSILNAFGGQLPLGRSTVLATVSPAAMKQQRAHHHLPGRWRVPLPVESLRSTAAALQARGIAAGSDETAVWAELPLRGTVPSRSIDPGAETALLRVDTTVAHPIAGAGYLATLRLPWTRPPSEPARLCQELNALEQTLVDFPPRFGAWGLLGRDDLPGYTCFIPATEPFGDAHEALMWWSLWRAAWIRDRCWARLQAGQAPGDGAGA